VSIDGMETMETSGPRGGTSRRTGARDLAQDSVREIPLPEVRSAGRAPPWPARVPNCLERPPGTLGVPAGACQRQPGLPKRGSAAAPTYFGVISQVPVLTSDFTGGIQDAPS